MLWDLEMMSQWCHHEDNWIKSKKNINNYSLESLVIVVLHLETLQWLFTVKQMHYIEYLLLKF